MQRRGRRRVQIYLETASPDELREGLGWRVVDGVTTNPSLLARQSGDSADVLLELCKLVPGPVLVEVTAQDTAGMIEEAEGLAGLHERLLVRIPCTPAGIPAIAALADRRIPVDASLCFSVTQALMAAKAGARFLSAPVGALDGAGGDGLALVGAIITVLDQYEIKTSVQATDLEHPGHVAEVARMGADAAAISLGLLRRLVDHPLTEAHRRDRIDRWRRAQN